MVAPDPPPFAPVTPMRPETESDLAPCETLLRDLGEVDVQTLSDRLEWKPSRVLRALYALYDLKRARYTEIEERRDGRPWRAFYWRAVPAPSSSF